MATTTSPRTTSSAPRDEGDTPTIIGPGIRVNGRITGEEDLQVEGHVEGEIQLSETLYVAVEGVVVADVQARDVVVSGILIGNVNAEDSITLEAGAKLVGDIAAPRLIIADGAAFRGNVTMAGEAPPRREQRATQARPRTGSASTSGARSRPVAPARDTSGPAASTPGRATAVSQPSRVPAIPRPNLQGPSDDKTVVVRHSELTAEDEEVEADEADDGTRRTAKKGPRARIPRPGKRRINRRDS